MGIPTNTRLILLQHSIERILCHILVTFKWIYFALSVYECHTLPPIRVLTFGSRVFALSFLNASRFALHTRITFNGTHFPLQGWSILIGKCMFSVDVRAVCWRSWRCFATIQCNLKLDEDAERKKRSEIATTNSLVWWRLKKNHDANFPALRWRTRFLLLLMCETEPFPKREGWPSIYFPF